MRILGFQKKWAKLGELEFTTFRFPRADKDWWLGELVQVVVKPRSKQREPVCIAQIVSITPIDIRHISEVMAIKDGFASRAEMLSWLEKTYHNQYRWLWKNPMNRLTLRRTERLSGHD